MACSCKVCEPVGRETHMTPPCAPRVLPLSIVLHPSPSFSRSHSRRHPSRFPLPCQQTVTTAQVDRRRRHSPRLQPTRPSSIVLAPATRPRTDMTHSRRHHRSTRGFATHSASPGRHRHRRAAPRSRTRSRRNRFLCRLSYTSVLVRGLSRRHTHLLLSRFVSRSMSLCPL
ncbi:hypothetical protein F5148DRAFT_718137 [Russula earlei]|uniref:Uncharacterized protein n=1 Tax=Russula earlei TaxID=71964 RepID=A0ACC0TTJ2_9AGAM|nr:hypothetical protein F5148DRAFT_718137 [Russula earlei]